MKQHTFVTGWIGAALLGVACGTGEAPLEVQRAEVARPPSCTVSPAPALCADTTLRFPVVEALDFSGCTQLVATVAQRCHVGHSGLVTAEWLGTVFGQPLRIPIEAMEQGCLVETGACPKLAARHNYDGPDWAEASHRSRAACRDRATQLARACYPAMTPQAVSTTYYAAGMGVETTSAMNLCLDGSCEGLSPERAPQRECLPSSSDFQETLMDASRHISAQVELFQSEGCGSPSYFAGAVEPLFQAVTTRLWLEEEGLGEVPGSLRVGAASADMRWTPMHLRGARRLRACVSVGAGSAAGPAHGCTTWR